MVLLSQRAGVKMVHVPYRGTHRRGALAQRPLTLVIAHQEEATEPPDAPLAVAPSDG
jgi:hypothetical protein